MQYISSRGQCAPVTAAEAICLGLAPDGGLFIPEIIPTWPYSWAELAAMDYPQTAAKVMKLFLDDYSEEELNQMTRAAYNTHNFSSKEIAPTVKLTDHCYLLELFHGPTAAFKDMALQIMPYLLVKAVEKRGQKQEVVILTATSGDTGKAALEGFKDVPGVKIIVFYPHGGVSPMQERQMNTTTGENTFVVSVKGNFDHCQTAVKNIFGDPQMNVWLAERGKQFSSANSINWGRLMPQIAYYFWTYASLMRQGQIKAGDKINIVVPTGNFGNILAAWYAGQMGLPVRKFICASNQNKVLTDVIQTGVYDRRREFYQTSSPSMDILVSSNFERFLFAVSGYDSAKIASWFAALKQNGVFTIDEALQKKFQNWLEAGFADEAKTAATIQRHYAQNGYVLDPHTAVGVAVYEEYQKTSGDSTPTIIASTASPFKFSHSVLQALGKEVPQGEEAQLEALAQAAHKPVPDSLAQAQHMPILHNTVVEVEGMAQIVKDILSR